MRLPLSGGCQCGGVRYEIKAKPLTVYVCHCTECQRQSGSAFAQQLGDAMGEIERSGVAARDDGAIISEREARALWSRAVIRRCASRPLSRGPRDG